MARGWNSWSSRRCRRRVVRPIPDRIRINRKSILKYERSSMITRRDFLQFSAAGLGTLALSDLAFAAGLKPFPVGVQLYTVRQQAEQDLGATLAHIAMIGYNEVETYWNVYTHPADKLRKMIVDNGLAVPSGHFDYDGLA